MPYTVARRNAALDAANDGIALAQLHDGDPGSAGTDNLLTTEVDAPAEVNFSGASNGTDSAQAEFTITAATSEITHISLWTDDGSGEPGVFMGSGALTPAEQFAGAGTLTVTINTSCTSS